jgi:hypothetical protein
MPSCHPHPHPSRYALVIATQANCWYLVHLHVESDDDSACVITVLAGGTSTALSFEFAFCFVAILAYSVLAAFVAGDKICRKAEMRHLAFWVKVNEGTLERTVNMVASIVILHNVPVRLDAAEQVPVLAIDAEEMGTNGAVCTVLKLRHVVYE